MKKLSHRERNGEKLKEQTVKSTRRPSEETLWSSDDECLPIDPAGFENNDIGKTDQVRFSNLFLLVLKFLTSIFFQEVACDNYCQSGA